MQNIVKRSGVSVAFNASKISQAITKALLVTGEKTDETKLTERVVAKLLEEKNTSPHIEDIQDKVEMVLMESGLGKTAKAYIIYRHQQELNRLRKSLRDDPIFVNDMNKYFAGNAYRMFIYLRTYSRWSPLKKRRESWSETVNRYITFLRNSLNEKDAQGASKLTDTEWKEIEEAVLYMRVMPSMRLLQFAGKATARENICAYNCSFIGIETLDDMVDAMYISMCGTGVGFSVEKQYVSKLPLVLSSLFKEGEEVKALQHTVEDSKEGWCNALRAGLNSWFKGVPVIFDYSLVRPYGTPLKTMGGYASGPDPLRKLLEFCEKTILSAKGKQLEPLAIHRIMCCIGRCVVVGGTRRSAMISISDLTDEGIRNCKKGNFWETAEELCMSNNSAAYNEIPDEKVLDEEWKSLIESNAGERGIFNRHSFKKWLPERRRSLIENVNGLGTNPCGEIILQSHQFCNLSTAVLREDEDEKSLNEKIRIATLIGTLQSTLTDFKYVSPKFKINCEKERLLGVSMTGQMDCPYLLKNADIVLPAIKRLAILYNQIYAKRLGIPQSSSVTCCKPEGTVSELTGSSSGCHGRFSRYYVRRVRVGSKDPIFAFLRDQGVSYHPEVGQKNNTATTYVVEFPIKSPASSVLEDDMTAIQQLEWWKKLKTLYTEHNPSVTIKVRVNEWAGVLAWVKNNWGDVCGLAFLPHSDSVYKLAPFQSLALEEYDALSQKTPKLDWSIFPSYEKVDNTDLKSQIACAGGACYLI